ncbi:MAG TPA: GNAT family N-acetyltransferase [Steroidobacteraceae bacterium]|nr:GNAT family N-acetyltransferase [Steroidobacteraceae bacterium]
MSLRVSAAADADVRAIAALRSAVAHDMTHKHGQGPWSAYVGRSTVLRQLRATRMLVARRDDEIVGTVRLMQADQTLYDYRAFTPATVALYVIGLAVAPHAHGQGVGRELMESAKAAARFWPAEALWLDTYESAAGAGRFYEKCGFRKVGAQRLNGSPLTYYEWRA